MIRLAAPSIATLAALSVWATFDNDSPAWQPLLGFACFAFAALWLALEIDNRFNPTTKERNQ